MLKSALTSWRTTTAGLLAAVLVSLGLVLLAREGAISAGELSIAVGTLLGSLGLLPARDNKVSSEEAGA